MTINFFEVEVQKNLPIPKSKQGRPKGKGSCLQDNGFSGLINDMEIGDCFTIHLEDDSRKSYYKIYQSILDLSKRADVKFTCRNLGDKLRFWKVEE